MDHSHHHHGHVTPMPTTPDHMDHQGDGHEYHVVTDAGMQDHMTHDHMSHDHVTHGFGTHGNHGADHSSHVDHHLSYFHSSLNATALFENWVLDTNGSIFLACLCTFVLAIGYQGTKWFRQYLHVNYRDKIHSIRSKEHVLQTVLYVTEYIVSYLLMLLVMTYNVWVFIVTVVGITVGYFLLAWHKEFKSGCSEDCPNVIDHKNKDYDRNPSSQELMPLENGVQAHACGAYDIEDRDLVQEDSD